MTLLTFTQVVLRYGFNSGLVWSLEATTYSFAALVLFGMSYGVRTQTHICADLLTRKLSGRPRQIVAVAATVMCVSYAVLMLYGSAVFVQQLFVLGNLARDVPAPKWLLTITMPIGFVLLGYRFLEAGWQAFRGSEGDGNGPVAFGSNMPRVDAQRAAGMDPRLRAGGDTKRGRAADRHINGRPR